MSIEALESRIAPAAVINLVTAGTSLKVFETDTTLPGKIGPINIQIGPDLTAGGVDIAAINGVTYLLNGAPVTPVNNSIHLAHVLGSITIDGGGTTGSNVTILPGLYGGNITMDFAAAGNIASIEATTIAGGVKVTAPLGGTSVFFNSPAQSTLIGGPVKLALGGGGNVVDVLVPQFTALNSFSFLGGPAKLTSGQPLGGTNLFVVVPAVGSGPLSFSVGGSLLFSAKYAAADFSISSANVSIAHSATFLEGAATGSSAVDTIGAGTLNIGGALTWNSNGGQGFQLSGGSVSVAGKLNVNEGVGNGLVQLTGNAMTIGGIVAVGSGSGGMQIQPGSPAQFTVNGSVKITNFGSVSISSLGTIGGSLSILGANSAHINDAFSSVNGAYLNVGGSVTVASPKTPTAPTSSFAFGEMSVGGSLKIQGGVTGSAVNLTDSRIFGSVSYTTPKLTGGNSLFAILQAANADTMLITGSLSVSLPVGNDTFVVQDANPIPTLLVLGTTKIAAPFPIQTLYNSALFASPVKIVP